MSELYKDTDETDHEFDRLFREFLKEFPNFADKGEQFLGGVKWMTKWWFLKGAQYSAQKCLMIEMEESVKAVANKRI